MLAARKLEEVKIFDLNEERCKAFAEEMQKGLAKYGATIIPAKDSDDCIEDADLIIDSDAFGKTGVLRDKGKSRCNHQLRRYL